MLVGWEGEEVPVVAPGFQKRADGDGEDGFEESPRVRDALGGPFVVADGVEGDVVEVGSEFLPPTL